MFVETMTNEEAWKEADADLNNAFGKFRHMERDVFLVARQTRNFPYVWIKEYVSPRRNKWLFMVHIYRRNIRNGGSGCMPVCLQKYPKGWAAHCYFLEGERQLTITLLPHFFDRYAQYNRTNLTGTELVKYVLKRMVRFETEKTTEYSGRDSRDGNVFHLIFDDGVGMGEYHDDGHAMVKTFITYDMTTGGQKEAFEEKRDRLGDPLEKNRRRIADGATSFQFS